MGSWDLPTARRLVFLTLGGLVVCTATGVILIIYEYVEPLDGVMGTAVLWLMGILFCMAAMKGAARSRAGHSQGEKIRLFDRGRIRRPVFQWASAILACCGGYGLACLLAPASLGFRGACNLVFCLPGALVLFLAGQIKGPVLFLNTGTLHGFYLPADTSLRKAAFLEFGRDTLTEVTPYFGNPKRYVTVAFVKGEGRYPFGTFHRKEKLLRRLLECLPEEHAINRASSESPVRDKEGQEGRAHEDSE